jgi:hypothetical protein
MRENETDARWKIVERSQYSIDRTQSRISHTKIKTTTTMVAVSYTDVMNVTTTWDKAKRTPKFEEVAGEAILTRLFTLEPQARTMFGFTADEIPKNSPKFAVHAKTMVDMLDMSVGFLGPDLEPIE